MNSVKRILPLLAVVLTLFVSSCNRGYGCPTNFSINEWWVDVVKAVLNVLF